jgi:membrane-bound serine protease (ClpP class)
MTAIGIALLVVGAAVVVVEAHVPAHGVIAGPGVIALAVGAVLAIDGLGGGLPLAIVTAFVLAAAGLGMVGLAVSKGAAVRRRGPRQALMGHLGVVRKWDTAKGTVLVDGALWHACPSHPEIVQPFSEGDQIVVERVTGLTLGVRKAEDWELVA